MITASCAGLGTCRERRDQTGPLFDRYFNGEHAIVDDTLEGRPPAGEHLLVVTHRPKPEGWHPEADVPFLDDATLRLTRRSGAPVTAWSACAPAMSVAKRSPLGLVDKVATDVVPVVLGTGKRYFGRVAGHHLLDDPHVVIQGDRVLHLRYKVRRPAT